MNWSKGTNHALWIIYQRKTIKQHKVSKYFQKEIANVRKESYKKGVEDTQKKMNNNVVFKNTSSTKIDDDILDDF